MLQSFGVKPETAIRVFNQSTGRSGSTEYKFPSFILNEKFDSGFSLELLRKDLEMAQHLFLDAEAATKLPQLIFDRFADAGNWLRNKDADHSEIYHYVSSYLLQRGNSNEKDPETISSSTNSSVSI